MNLDCHVSLILIFGPYIPKTQILSNSSQAYSLLKEYPLNSRTL